MKIWGFFSVSIRVKESNHCNSSLLGRANNRDVNIMMKNSLKVLKRKENLNLFQCVQLIQKYTVHNF